MFERPITEECIEHAYTVHRKMYNQFTIEA